MKGAHAALSTETRRLKPVDNEYDKGFKHGVCYAVSMMLVEGQVSLAEELWISTGMRGVPAYVDRFDAEIIRRAIRCGWGRDSNLNPDRAR